MTDMNELQWGFVFHKESCIQCHGCEGACKMWRAMEAGVRWRRVRNIWEGAYPEVTCSSVSVSCLHCTDPACVRACPAQAITKRASDGLVLVDQAKCTGCRLCLEACPVGAPQFGSDGLMQKCDMCLSDSSGAPGAQSAHPPCAATCPTGALELVKMSASEKRAAEQDIFSAYKSGNS